MRHLFIFKVKDVDAPFYEINNVLEIVNKYLLITNKKTINLNNDIGFNGDKLQRVCVMKYIGIIIYEHLRFDMHVSKKLGIAHKIS